MSELAATTGGRLNPSGTIEEDLLRERVALYLRAMFLIDVALYLVTSSLMLFGWDPQVQVNLAVSLAMRLGITGSLLWGWLYAARRRPSEAMLVGMESGLTLIVAWLYVHLAVNLPDDGPVIALFIISLALTLRASLVPSPVGRTVVVGALVMMLSSLAAWWSESTMSETSLYWLPAAGAGFVAVTAVISRVIYGLQREVREARRLGQYELGRKLGEGGMGTVYEATHVLLRRPTAVKLLPIDKVGEKTVKRFEREVRQTSRLQHPNSVYVYDYGRTPDGLFYYAMEYLDGIDLQSLVTTYGQLEPARVVAILRQAAAALAEAHNIGLVHRDIKPANIMLCERALVPDTVKVLDFGLVKALDDADPGETAADTILGTPHYMSPEAIERPDEVGPPSDVYALGAVGYYLLTARTVFDAKTVVEVCAQHLRDRPRPPTELLEEPLDQGLEAMILRCLEKDPEQRFADGAELGAALSSLDLPGWSEEDARRWWAENDIRSARSDSPPRTRPLTVELLGRSKR